MTGRKTFSILLGMLLMGAVALVSSAQGAEKKSRGADDSHGAKGAAARAVLSNPVSLPAEDADQGASGYAKAELATPPGSTTPIQKLEVKAHDLTANQRYRIEVADRAEGGPNITNLGVFLTDDTGELEVEFHSMAGPNTPGHVVLNLGNIANVLAIDAIRMYRVDETASDGTVIRETLVLEGKFGPVADRHRNRGGRN